MVSHFVLAEYHNRTGNCFHGLAFFILDMDRYNSDYVFRSAADSAKRAILEASPFKIPSEKMYLFRDFEFSFNTDKALGG